MAPVADPDKDMEVPDGGEFVSPVFRHRTAACLGVQNKIIS